MSFRLPAGALSHFHGEDAPVYFLPPNGNPQFLPGPTKMRRKPEALNFKEEPSTVVMPTSLTSQRELSHHRAAIIQETHRTNPELFPSRAHACLYAQLLQPAFSHSRGLHPSRLLCPRASPCTQQILFPCISGEFCVRVQCRGVAPLTAPSGTAAEPRLSHSPRTSPGQSCSDLTVHPNSTTCSKASPEPAELGRAKTACLWAGLQDARPGAQAPLSERGPSLGGFGRGRHWRCAPPPADPGRLTGRLGPALASGALRISAPRRPEPVLSCE